MVHDMYMYADLQQKLLVWCSYTDSLRPNAISDF